MFRNKEIQQFTVCFVLIAAAFAAAGFLLQPAAGILVLILAAALGVAFFIFTRACYENIARIADQIDLVLHSEDELFMTEAEEGELSILQSEITKMTVRIREQNHALKQEKQHLADSLADIAHQLRTPLTSANLILTLLKKNPDERERMSLLRENEELFAQMDWLVTSLLKLSRLDAGIITFQKTPIPVADLVQEAARPLAISMELHDITLQIHVPEEAELLGDMGWLSEAIRNLLKNCLESISNQGGIVVSCEDNLLFTEIIIHDSGAGFHKEDLPHLFDRFYRGKHTSATGYGIGLALCKSIITRQGGTVTAKNHPKGGAVFTIRFSKVTDLSRKSHRDVS
ncbi:MAG: HAMP domain-containing sensor histidine kinase [Lachnospiraceae bacterium]|nr:HAMP domain-containing sensor histidine kinase [Lachnospiraceae bacterium]